MNRQTKSVVVAAEPEVGQAEVTCAVLRNLGFDAYVVDGNISSLLWHVSLAINPTGIRIAVPAEQAEEAWQVLARLREEDLDWTRQDDAPADEDAAPGPEGPTVDSSHETPGTPDYHAARAALCSLFTFLLPPLLLLVPYHLVKAIGARRTGPASLRYRLHVGVGMFMLAFWLTVIFIVAGGLEALTHWRLEFG